MHKHADLSLDLQQPFMCSTSSGRHEDSNLGACRPASLAKTASSGFKESPPLKTQSGKQQSRRPSLWPPHALAQTSSSANIATLSYTLHTKAARQTQNTINDRYWYLIRLCVFAAVLSQLWNVTMCTHHFPSPALGHLYRLLGKASLHFCQFLTSLLGFSYLELGIFYSRGSKPCLIAGHWWKNILSPTKIQNIQVPYPTWYIYMCPAYILNIKLSLVSLDQEPTGTVAGCTAFIEHPLGKFFLSQCGEFCHFST